MTGLHCWYSHSKSARLHPACQCCTEKRKVCIKTCFHLIQLEGVILYLNHPVGMCTPTDHRQTTLHFSSLRRDSFDWQRTGQGKYMSKHSLLRRMALFLQLLSNMTQEDFLYLRKCEMNTQPNIYKCDTV